MIRVSGMVQVLCALILSLVCLKVCLAHTTNVYFEKVMVVTGLVGCMHYA